MSHSVKAVRYTGSADRRIISESDWLAIDVQKQGSSIWDASNEKVLPGADFTDSAIVYFQRDNEFILEQETSKA